MLRRIYADNFRCFVNFEFRPDSVNLLVGRNGSGKTVLFEILEGIQDILIWNSAVQDAFSTASLTRWDTRNIQRFELEIEEDDECYRYELEIEHDRERETAVIRSERLSLDELVLYASAEAKVQLYRDNGSSGPEFTFDPRRSFLGVIEERPDNRKLSRFKKFILDMWIFRLAPDALIGESKREEDWLKRDGSNFASWYRNLVQEAPEAIDELNTNLRELIEGYRSLKFIPGGGNTKVLVASCRSGAGESSPSYELALSELSDGQRALLLLYTIVHAVSRSARLVCFDEPDNFVAPREIQPFLMSLSEKLEDSGGQAFIISHHPETIDYLASGAAFRFDRPNGAFSVVRPLEINRDTGLKASEILARGWE